MPDLHTLTSGMADQWPDNICSGDITYGRADNYGGFFLADVQHGIPTIGAVAHTQPPTVRGQHVEIFNYPEQTEAIAKQLVLRWNAHEPLVYALKNTRACLALITEQLDIDAQGTEVTVHAVGPQGQRAVASRSLRDVYDQADAALSRALSQSPEDSET